MAESPIRIQLWIDPQQNEELRELAFEKRTTKSELVREAIDLYLNLETEMKKRTPSK